MSTGKKSDPVEGRVKNNTAKQNKTEDKKNDLNTGHPPLKKQDKESVLQNASVKPLTDDEVITSIELERLELTQEEQEHLLSHKKIDADNQLNHEMYCSAKSYKRVEINFSNLRAGSKAFINLRPDQKAIWSEGDQSNRLVGLGLTTTKDDVLFVSNFLVNARELFIQTYDLCSEIKVQLYVLTDQKFIKGRVDLPPEASVTFQSLNDRSTIIGLSSFAIDLD